VTLWEQPDEPVRQSLREPPTRLARPAPRRLVVAPEDLEDVARTARDVGGMAGRRAGEARSRLETARELSRREAKTASAEEYADQL
jgi:hypothetical protein